MPTRYRALELLGESRRAQVWRAEGPSGPVVVKRARTGHSLAGQIAALTTCAHPGVVRVLDADPGGAWFVMPLLDGGRVDLWARGQPLGPTLDCARRLAETLVHLHTCGWTHGDLKPDNVLVDGDGRPVLVDLGDPGAGTAGWRAPEVVPGVAPGPQADVYALGAVFYALVTGRPPAPEGEPYGRAHLPEAPASLRPRLPAAVDLLVRDMLHPRPERRPSAAEVSRRLAAGADGPLSTGVVVGMGKERATLRRAVLDVWSGPSRVVVVYGPPGSGRGTLIAEAATEARRLGFTHDAHEAADPGAPVLSILESAAGDTERVLRRRLATPGPALVLVRAPHPLAALARLGAAHLRVPPLDTHAVALLLEGAGRDRRTAEDLRRRARGHAGTVARLVAATRDPPAADPALGAALARLAEGPVSVPALAAAVGLGEHALLDLIEPLLDDATLSSSPDGYLLSFTRGPGEPAGSLSASSGSARGPG